MGLTLIEESSKFGLLKFELLRSHIVSKHDDYTASTRVIFANRTHKQLLTQQDEERLAGYIKEMRAFFKRSGGLLPQTKEGVEICRRGRKAIRQLVESHIPLAYRMCHRYAMPWDGDDVIQNAMIGLIGAARDFVPQPGKRFASLAIPAMRNCIRRYLRAPRATIHVPLWVEKRITQKDALEAEKKLEERTTSSVGDGRMFWKQTRWGDWQLVNTELAGRLAMGVQSLDRPDVNEQTLHETLPNPDLVPIDVQMEFEERMAVVQQALQQLPQPYQEVIEYRFGMRDGEHWLQKDLASKLGVTQTVISDKELRSKRMLKKLLAHDIHPQ